MFGGVCNFIHQGRQANNHPMKRHPNVPSSSSVKMPAAHTGQTPMDVDSHNNPYYDHYNNQPYQHHHHHADYSKIARDLVQKESEAEEKIKKQSRQSIRNYKVLEKLGEGAFSKVYKAVNIETGAYVAIKVIQKYQLDVKQRSSVLKEVALMRKLNHPNIVSFVDFIENDQCYYIVQELVEGGELFNQIVKYTYFSEDLSRHVIIQVAEALLYLHETVGIVHRDLKPENVFFCPIPVTPSRVRRFRHSDDPNNKLDEGEFKMNYGGGGIGLVKVGDFGLSKQLIANKSLKTPCGTLGYTAPEIVKDMKYSKEVDMWGLGCLLYITLCGFPPFFNDSIEELTEKVSKGEYEFLSPWWDEISFGAKHCVAKLLTVDPKERYSITEFLNDPWILEFLHRSSSNRNHTSTTHDIATESYSDMSPVMENANWGERATLPRYESSTFSSSYDSRETSNDTIPTSKQLMLSSKPDVFSPAVIAMKEAMDITAVARRLREETNISPRIAEDGLNRQHKAMMIDGNTNTTKGSIRGDLQKMQQAIGLRSFRLNINESSILQRRKHKPEISS